MNRLRDRRRRISERINNVSNIAYNGDTRLTSNVFCPTGQGGGIDPTCKGTDINENPKKWLQEQIDALKASGQHTKKKEKELNNKYFQHILASTKPKVETDIVEDTPNTPVSNPTPKKVVKSTKQSDELPSAKSSSDTYVNPTYRTASQIRGVNPGAPLKRVKLYHITTHAAAQEILKNGFDIFKAKPRYINDYAVSLTHGTAEQGMKYLTKPGQSFNHTKYAVLEVDYEGHTHKGRSIENNTTDAQVYREKMMDKGIDGYDRGDIIHIYNPKAIRSVKRLKF